MSHTCQGVLKTKAGGICGKGASYSLVGSDGREEFYCGVHGPKLGAELIAGAKTRSGGGAAAAAAAAAAASGAPAVPPIYNEIFEAIMRRIEDGSVTNGPHFTSFQSMNSEERAIIIRRASELCGSKSDVLLIAAEIKACITEYEIACRQHRLPIVLGMDRLRSIGAEWAPISRDGDDEPFCVEEGFCVVFPDVNMMIGNVSSDYLKKMRMTFQQICEQENVIYMGRADVIRTPLGEAVPQQNSPWYIPLPYDCPYRQVHNKSEVVRILDAIERGEPQETPPKYLELRGKMMLCTCMPYPCHCEVYVEVVRELLRRSQQ